MSAGDPAWGRRIELHGRGQQNDADPEKPKEAADWAAGSDGDERPPCPVNEYFRFRVEDGTRQSVLVLAGDMRDMSGFGVRVRLAGPA